MLVCYSIKTISSTYLILNVRILIITFNQCSMMMCDDELSKRQKVLFAEFYIVTAPAAKILVLICRDLVFHVSNFGLVSMS